MSPRPSVLDFLAEITATPSEAEQLAAGIDTLDPVAFDALRGLLVDYLTEAADQEWVTPSELPALALTHLASIEQVVTWIRFALGRTFAPPSWSAEDAAVAFSQGWNLFLNDGDGHRWQLQRDDSAATFPDDEAAWRFVRARAVAGDGVALRALLFLRYECPDEYATILKDPGHDLTA